MIVRLSPICRHIYEVTLTHFQSWNRVCLSCFFSSRLLWADLWLTWNTCNNLYRTLWKAWGRILKARSEKALWLWLCSWECSPLKPAAALYISHPDALRPRPTHAERSHSETPNQQVGELPHLLPPALVPSCSSFSHWRTPSQTQLSTPVFLTHKNQVCAKGTELKDAKGCD